MIKNIPNKSILGTVWALEIYRTFVLIELDENAAQDKLLAQIKADQQLYDAIKASELIDEMEQKVEAYRQRK